MYARTEVLVVQGGELCSVSACMAIFEDGREGVSGCLWNLIVCECGRDRTQREEDRTTKRGDSENDKRRDEERHQKIQVHVVIYRTAKRMA